MKKGHYQAVRILLVLAMVVAIVGVVATPSAAQVTGLSPSAGPVGTSVTITATGFAPNSILTATFGSAAVATAPVVIETDATGAATFALLVPAASAWAHTIRVSDGVNSVGQTFTVQPKVTINPPLGPVGTTATVTGSGFAPGVTADVTVGGVSFKRSVAVDVDGSFTAESTIPLLSTGAQTVTAFDGAGNDADLNPNVFTVTPSLELDPSSGYAGSRVDITGSGWYEWSDVDFTFGGANWWAAQTTVLADGTIDASNIQIPTAATPGVKAVTGFDGTNVATVNFTVEPRILNLTPSSGPMGTAVLITGADMTPDGTILEGMVLIGGRPWSAAGIYIDTDGIIAPTTLTVPSGLVVGENIVAAIDDAWLAAGNVFTVTKPTLDLDRTSGPRGSDVRIEGSGWVPSSSVTIGFAGAVMATSVDVLGNIAAPISVPGIAYTGENAIEASDAFGNVADDAIFTVPGPAISVAPAETYNGASITIQGSGFAAYAPIAINIGGYQLPTTPLTDEFGAFTLAATVPGVAPGTQVVMAQDVASTATTFLTVTEAPPAIIVSLVWNTDGDDLDAHLVAPGYELGDGFGDCGYANMNPDWDDTGILRGDPMLSADSIDSLSPEYITLVNPPFDGLYLVAVDFPADAKPVEGSDATVTVWINGDPVFERTMHLAAGDTWEAANIAWPSGVVTALPYPTTEVGYRDIPLGIGWNLVSLPLAPADPSIEVVLADIRDNVASVWTYDNVTASWTMYTPGPAPDSLTEIVEGPGYWINMQAAPGHPQGLGNRQRASSFSSLKVTV